MPTQGPPKIRILDRYLLARYLQPFCYCVAAFLLVMLIYDFSINLEDFVEGKVRLDIILEYFVYSLPMKIVDIMPMSSLLSALFCIGQLKKHNEILALQASGISLVRLMVPFLCFGVALSVAVLLLNETLIPSCQRRVAKIELVYMKKGESKRPAATAAVFAFYNLQQQRSWVGVLDPSKKKLLKVEIREFDKDGKVLKKITAEEAEPAADGWKLAKGKYCDYMGGMLGKDKIRAFDSEVFIFSETLKDLLDSQKDTEFMSLHELAIHVRIHPKHSRVYHEEKVDYYHKWAYPFLNFLVMLMALPTALKTDKAHFFLGVAKSLGLFLGYYGLNLISITMGKNELIAAWLGGLFPTIFYLALGWQTLRRTN